MALSGLTILALSSFSSNIFVNVSVDLRDASHSEPFIHRWKKSFGSGHAALTLRDDWREHLSRAVAELGLTGVRYHGLFDDDMGPVVTIDANGAFSYNWCVVLGI